MKRTLIYTPLAEPLMIGVVSVAALVLCIFSSNLLILSIVFLYIFLILFVHVYVRKISHVHWEYIQGSPNTFIGEKNICSIKISNNTILPIFNIVFRFKCDNRLSWKHDALNKNQSTGSNYYMKFNMKGEEIRTFDIQAIALKRGIGKWEEVEIVISDPFGLIMSHLTYSQIDTPVYLIFPAVPNIQVPELKEWSRGFRKSLSSPLYDETNVIGIKNYENEDFRSIHWSATAKTGIITAKKYERTQSDKYALYLNLINKNGVSIRKDTEELIEITAGMCKQLLLQDCSYELWINSVNHNGLLHIKLGNSRKQLQNTLKVLASIKEQDTPVSSSYFFTSGFRRKQLDAIPLIIGTSPKANNRSEKWVVIKE
ncbi:MULTISPECIES: DUF58 domain-containing protein [Bacillus cereus group]|nr:MULTISPECIES: DUF58 domain-containing protein [Bacillus cereus group]MDX5837656.1 DUF58 domain-containing protein [Bacillus cereus group sp. BfR-BA-01700]MED4386522.1 DUF58 domain-containing protein [Bacillus mobilis]NEK98361.1 DUF58 domain-containing protein [Bacillus mobilis]OJE42567.1 hypothetical protein BAQ44_07200 [Bacillus mobilis]PHA31810.1 DUF58 domain-containing protein [Bacillus wiedmannii]